MKKHFLITLVLGLTLIAAQIASAQKYQLTNTKTKFFSTTPIEDIEGTTKETKGIIDESTQSFFFKIVINSFEFKSDLMRDHFQENYMESEKYPTATFKGKIEGNFDMTKDGVYLVNASGQMTIHGQSKEVVIPSKIIVKDGKRSIQAVFKIKLVDYKIEIPTVVFNKIAEQVEVTVVADLISLKD